MTQVIAHLTKNNLQVCLPLSEHLPFDLLAVDEAMKVYKVQVKYRSLRDGVIHVELFGRANTSTKRYHKDYDMNEIDIVAVYNPESDTVFYFKSDLSDAGKIRHFRVTEAKKVNQHGRTPLLSEFTLEKCIMECKH